MFELTLSSLEEPGDGDPWSGLCIEVHRRGKPFGVLAIDSFFQDSARGGIRIATDVTPHEVKLLARDMTLKFGFLGLPQGGAKAGIIADGEAPEPERYQALLEFGRALAPLLRQGIYRPGADIGTTVAMIRRMLTDLGVRIPGRELRGGASGYYTALTVFTCIRHGLRFLERPLDGATAVIEGFGKVGAPLARFLSRSGIRVVAVSTSRGGLYNSAGIDIEDALAAQQAQGSSFVLTYPKAERIPREQIFLAEADILAPCARSEAVSPTTAHQMRVRLVAPGSNSPYAGDAEAVLHNRGVLCLPDFVCNCGGVLGETLAFAGWTQPDIEQYADRQLGAALRNLLQKAKQAGQPPSAIAATAASRRFAALSNAVRRPGIRTLAWNGALEIYRHGIGPRWLARHLSRGYFEGRVLTDFGAATNPRAAGTARMAKTNSA